MYKLWRREVSKPKPVDPSIKKREAEFSESLAQILKIIRKKEQFYIKVIFTKMDQPIYLSHNSIEHRRPQIIRQHTMYPTFGQNMTIQVSSSNLSNNLVVHQLQQQIEELMVDEQKTIDLMKEYQDDQFFLSKTQDKLYPRFLYTMFVRLLENHDYSKQKISLKVKNQEPVYSKNWEKLYEEHKIIMTDCYQNLVYFQNYNVVELVSLALKKQNHRIFSILPAKIRKNQIALKPLLRVNSSEFKKTHSIDIKAKKQKSQIAEVLERKLSIKEKRVLMTEKRIQQRKRTKQKPLSFKQLYGIMGVKAPKIQEGNAYRKQLQMDAMERNFLILQEIKKWEKKLQTKKSSAKLLILQQNK